MIEKTANDFSNYVEVGLQSKLEPINQSVDEMLARLEEFQTMLQIVKQEQIDSTEILSSILNFHTDLKQLCLRIDAVENLVTHIKSNVNDLEIDIEKAEEQIGVADSTTKVTNMLIPLFKKNVEKNSTNKDIFHTEEYFDSQ